MDPLCKSWLRQAPSTPFLEIDFSGDRLTVSISKETTDLLSFLESEYGIEYTDPVLSLCG
jgi:hypothetical protein